MKILVLNWRDPLHPEAGGAEIHLDKILTKLAESHEVCLVSTCIPHQEFSYTRNGYLVERAGHPLFFHLTFKNQWNKHYSRMGYDLVIDDISKIGLCTPNYIKDVPLIGIFHHIHGKTLYDLLPYPIAWYVHYAERWALKNYINIPIIVVSPSTQKELLNLYPYKDLRVIPNGIDDDFFTNGVKKPLQFCYIGRITKAKGIHYSLEAFAKVLKIYPTAKFIIAGKGKDSDRLHAMVKDMQIEHAVEFRGFINEQEKIALYAESGQIFFTSKKEGWGITAIESSAGGSPVFGFDVPGVRDSVKNGQNGYLVPFGDVNSLVDKVLWYLASPEEQKRLSHRAQDFARSFSWEVITKNFEEEVLKIVEQFHEK